MNRIRSALLIGSVISLCGTAEAAAAESRAVPLVAQANAGPCHMTVSGGSSSFLIEVTGLRPNEPLKLTSTSEGEVLRWEGTAQDDGRFGTIIIPLVKGKTFGTASFEVEGQRCQIEASYPWREEKD